MDGGATPAGVRGRPVARRRHTTLGLPGAARHHRADDAAECNLLAKLVPRGRREIGAFGPRSAAGCRYETVDAAAAGTSLLRRVDTNSKAPAALAIPTIIRSLHELLESIQATTTSAAADPATPAGATNGAGGSFLHLKTGRAAAVAPYVKSLMIVVVAASERKVPDSVIPSMPAAVSRIEACGVRKRR